MMAPGLVPGVHAQGLEEVVVRARKRSETSRDVPISITALGVGEIENRRIGAGHPSNLSVDPAVGIYRDGAYSVKIPGSALDLIIPALRDRGLLSPVAPARPCVSAPAPDARDFDTHSGRFRDCRSRAPCRYLETDRDFRWVCRRFLRLIDHDLAT